MLWLRTVSVVSEEAAGLWGVPEKEIREGVDSIRYCRHALGTVAAGIKRGVPSAGSGKPSAALQDVLGGAGHVALLSLLVYLYHHTVLSGLASDSHVGTV